MSIKKESGVVLNLKKDMTVQDTLSEKRFNVLLGGSIVYGLLINILLCAVLVDKIGNYNQVGIIIGLLIVGIIGIFIMHISNRISFILAGYTVMCMACGVLVAVSVAFYDTTAIYKAVIVTTIVTLAMTVVSYLKPKFFLSLGKSLEIILIILIIVEIIVCLLTGELPTIFSFIFVVIFSLLIGYDWQCSQTVPKTFKNAILCAGELYLDIINIFIDLLDIFSDD